MSRSLSSLAGGFFSRSLPMLLAVVLPPAAAQATVFNLTATDVVIEDPSPLFTSPTISGTLTLADDIMPGESFGTSSLTALTLNYGGIQGDLADVQAEIAPGPIQFFGTRSLDGNSFSVLDFRFGFPTSTPGCSFVCAGQIIINSPIGGNDPSNFLAVDDPDGTTLSVIDSYTPEFSRLITAVPEPASWMLMIVGAGVVGWALRRQMPDRRSRRPVPSRSSQLLQTNPTAS